MQGTWQYYAFNVSQDDYQVVVSVDEADDGTNSTCAPWISDLCAAVMISCEGCRVPSSPHVHDCSRACEQQVCQARCCPPGCAMTGVPPLDTASISCSHSLAPWSGCKPDLEAALVKARPSGPFLLQRLLTGLPGTGLSQCSASKPELQVMQGPFELVFSDTSLYIVVVSTGKAVAGRQRVQLCGGACQLGSAIEP